MQTLFIFIWTLLVSEQIWHMRIHWLFSFRYRIFSFSPVDTLWLKYTEDVLIRVRLMPLRSRQTQNTLKEPTIFHISLLSFVLHSYVNMHSIFQIEKNTWHCKTFSISWLCFSWDFLHLLETRYMLLYTNIAIDNNKEQDPFESVYGMSMGCSCIFHASLFSIGSKKDGSVEYIHKVTKVHAFVISVS